MRFSLQKKAADEMHIASYLQLLCNLLRYTENINYCKKYHVYAFGTHSLTLH